MVTAAQWYRGTLVPVFQEGLNAPKASPLLRNPPVSLQWYRNEVVMVPGGQEDLVGFPAPIPLFIQTSLCVIIQGGTVVQWRHVRGTLVQTYSGLVIQ
eukprot:5295965-Karenia_brevis.AAC.1